jgi:YHS domain-containing protein
MSSAIASVFLACTCLAAEFGSAIDGPIKVRAVPLEQYKIEMSLPAGSPPLGLEGYCPVKLRLESKWRLGEANIRTVHGERTYLFATEENRQLFLKDPEKYSPLFSGADPYLAVESKKTIDGRRRYGIFYDDRVILFACRESCAKFEDAPRRYLEEAKSYFSGTTTFDLQSNEILQPSGVHSIECRNYVNDLRAR